MNLSNENIITGASVLAAICIIGWLHWRNERNKRLQKWRHEAIRFWNYIDELDVDPEIVKELMRKMKTTEDFENANRRLSGGLKKTNEKKIILSK